MADIANKILKGNSGNAWVQGKLLSNLSKIEAKISGDFEDVNFCGDNATHSVYNGWSGEGSVTLKKIDSYVWKIIADAYKNGIMPDITIISKLEDKSTGKAERVALKGVVFTELTLVGFEAKTMIEEEFAFKFSDYEVLETL